MPPVKGRRNGDHKMKYYTIQLSDKGNVAVDDTILVKGVQTAAGSRILEGFEPLFSAEAVTRLEDAGYVISLSLIHI